ncbi:MAG TPA: alanine racemase C-terminal domain-containing protein [Acidimicrobiia bacterium]|nr:alanine racemase C-terminal domain-containing protein [Acidimicrobiia bacterium]
MDVGDADVHVGDEVVLIGQQEEEQLTANEWAERLDTIGYEIVCGIGSRVPRVYL